MKGASFSEVGSVNVNGASPYVLDGTVNDRIVGFALATLKFEVT